MHDAVRTIQREHFNLSAVLTALEQTVDAMEEGREDPDFALLRIILVYLQSFADRFHHPKEDEYLFRAVRRRQPEMAPMLDALEAEHRRGKTMAEAMRAALDGVREGGEAGRAAFCAEARRYIAFERQHMETEEEIVLPAAEEVLTPEDWDGIDAAFGENEDPVFGDRRQASFDRLFARIEKMLPDTS